jgi:putative membrane protein
MIRKRFWRIRRHQRSDRASTEPRSPVARADTREGTEPDPRFSFANERTFLAWSRTALALVVAGLAVTQLLLPFPGIPWGRHIIGVPLMNRLTSGLPPAPG